jgi:hypothetical protein
MSTKLNLRHAKTRGRGPLLPAPYPANLHEIFQKRRHLHTSNNLLFLVTPALKPITPSTLTNLKHAP